MRSLFLLAVAALLLATSASAQTAPPNRVRLFDQQLFLSGGNIAWINFARDVGPGTTDLEGFRRIFEEVHANGGNSVRFWVHINGSSTPAWSGTTLGEVVGPGAGTIDDLRAILDLAQQEEIGVQVCLWSFDMLRTENGAAITSRARALLASAALTQSYIDTALTPMVDALKDHPALLAWEIFNEPEGMSTEFVFTGVVAETVPMSVVQRFTNQLAGAIHRAAPTNLVTNGSVNMRPLLDLFRGGRQNTNYYRDDRLIAAGGDPLGTLDYYNAHTYVNGVSTEISPFLNDASIWGLDKPIVIGEFYAPNSTNGIPYQDLYTTAYDRGYAGALVWQHYDINRGDERALNWPRGLENMRTMYAQHRSDVEVLLPGPDVMAFTADPTRITAGSSTTLRWTVSGAATVTINGVAAPSGSLSVSPTATTVYTLVATDAAGLTDQRRLTVSVVSGTPANRYEAEAAALVDATIRTSLPAASGGSHVQMDGSGSIAWTVTVPAAGVYTARFGYYLPFSRKEQFLDVNGVRVDTVRFEEPTSTFLTADAQVTLTAGANTVTLSKFFGYMNVDYLDLVAPVAGEAGPEAASALGVEAAPNPLRDATRLRYTLGSEQDVTVDVFDVTGRRVVRLAEGREAAGVHEVRFDARALPAGVYVARVTAGASVETRRLLVVR